MRLGVCYYPEHWEESLWEEDLLRMRDYGIDTIRIGEFAWSLFEPTEGVFDFSMFDRFLALTEKTGMQVIMGTPTATPPIWLTERYPEVLNATADGTLYRHGLRRHYNYNSKKYQELSTRIVTRMGEHFGHHPMVIGWQIDNEINCETPEFHSEADHAAFREYMKDNYETLENLNEKMGGNVWSQRYTEWDQVTLRRPTVNGHYNPHLLLEEKRFFSESAIWFCRMQCDILRPLIGDAFLTTNGIFDNLDYTRLMQGLDFLCYDSYPNFALAMDRSGQEDPLFLDRKWSKNLSVVRALCAPFGIMEQQGGANGWTGRMEAPMPRPGQLRLWTFQSIAHGADFISFFRWRTAPYGTEIYWHGLLDYDNYPGNRRMQELAEISRDMHKLPVEPGQYLARIAVLRNYDNEWDAALDKWHERVEKVSERGLFEAAQLLHEPMDYLYMNESVTPEQLKKYDLVIWPHATILEDRYVDVLRSYMETGGQVMFGARTGYKDAFGRCPMRPMGFGAAELAGIRIEDYTFIGPYDEPGMAEMDGTSIEMPVFNDVLLASEGTQVEARYSSNYYKGKPAIVSRTCGQGRIWYVGSAFSRKTAMCLLKKLGFGEPYQAYLTLPEECELAVRGNLCFVLNYGRNAAGITVHEEMQDVLLCKQVVGQQQIAPFDVRVYALPETGK